MISPVYNEQIYIYNSTTKYSHHNLIIKGFNVN